MLLQGCHYVKVDRVILRWMARLTVFGITRIYRLDRNQATVFNNRSKVSGSYMAHVLLCYATLISVVTWACNSTVFDIYAVIRICPRDIESVGVFV